VGRIGDPDAAAMSDVELSPDGKRVAVERRINNNTDIWLVEAASGAPTRFTFDVGNDLHPSWLPGGRRIQFQSNRTGVYNLYTKLSSAPFLK
jgi:Tol biopolymer transport system component